MGREPTIKAGLGFGCFRRDPQLGEGDGRLQTKQASYVVDERHLTEIHTDLRLQGVTQIVIMDRIRAAIMPVKTMSAREAKNAFGVLLDTARAEPVSVEKHGRPVVVVLSVEEFERMRRRGLRPSAGKLNDKNTTGHTK